MSAPPFMHFLMQSAPPGFMWALPHHSSDIQPLIVSGCDSVAVGTLLAVTALFADQKKHTLLIPTRICAKPFIVIGRL
jgi:hypothetical protein